MPREHYSELLAFVAVARELNFTRAAAQLGMSQSMLSHSVRQLEARLGVRLLTRTTRSVSVTEAGERLLKVAIPRLRDIETELRSVIDLGNSPAGTIRITATDHAVDTLLWPKLADVLHAYPKIRLEIHAGYAPPNIISGRYDFEVRLGDQLPDDIHAVRVGADLQLVVVGAPSYFASHPLPDSPQDLVGHDCINLRLAAHGNLYTWKLGEGSREMSIRVNGRMVFTGIYQVLNATLSGYGLAYVPEDLVRPHLEAGRLLPVLKPWWRLCPGYHLLYAGQHEPSRAMQVLIDALRYTE